MEWRSLPSGAHPPGSGAQPALIDGVPCFPDVGSLPRAPDLAVLAVPRTAADACTDLGLDVHHPGERTKGQLRAIIPGEGSVNGPVDTAATVSADAFRQVLETLAADEDVHAIIALVLRTGATGDLLAAIAAADVGVPLAVVQLNQPEAVRVVDAKRGKVPVYAYPEVAARALSRAVRYAEWRAAPRQTVPAFPDVDPAPARNVVADYLSRAPGGGWLPLR